MRTLLPLVLILAACSSTPAPAPEPKPAEPKPAEPQPAEPKPAEPQPKPKPKPFNPDLEHPELLRLLTARRDALLEIVTAEQALVASGRARPTQLDRVIERLTRAKLDLAPTAAARVAILEGQIADATEQGKRIQAQIAAGVLSRLAGIEWSASLARVAVARAEARGDESTLREARERHRSALQKLVTVEEQLLAAGNSSPYRLSQRLEDALQVELALARTARERISVHQRRVRIAKQTERMVAKSVEAGVSNQLHLMQARRAVSAAALVLLRAQGKATPEDIRKEQEARVEHARRSLAAQKLLLAAGAGTPFDVQRDRLALMDAELALDPTGANRLALLQKRVELARESEEETKARARAGLLSTYSLLQSRIATLDAEIALLRERLKK